MEQQAECEDLIYHILFEKNISDVLEFNTLFNNLFNIQRIVFIKKSSVEKKLFKSVILFLRSRNNVEVLEGCCGCMCNIKTKISKITAEEAENIMDQKKTKIYVGNIPASVDNLQFWSYFSKFGKLDFTNIVKKADPKSGKGAPGFGFVIYEDKAVVEAVLKLKHAINGTKLRCKLFENKNKLKKCKKTEEPAKKSVPLASELHSEREEPKEALGECEVSAEKEEMSDLDKEFFKSRCKCCEAAQNPLIECPCQQRFRSLSSGSSQDE